jgi:hypothetical protein
MEITRFFLKLTKPEGRILVVRDCGTFAPAVCRTLFQDLAYDAMIMFNIPMHGRPSAADTRRVQEIVRALADRLSELRLTILLAACE